MKPFKKICLSACSLLLCAALTGCGVFNPAKEPNEILTGGNQNNHVQTGNPEDLENPFVVSLTYRGMPFTEAQGITAQWTDDYSYYTAPFNENGEAAVEGLDGDYRVTLSALPEGFTYNPNVHVATNNNREIEIELYRAVVPEGNGHGLYVSEGCMQISTTNMYRVTLNNADDIIYIQFSPRKSGTYTVESWVDVTAQQINPICEVYHGSSAYKIWAKTLEDGGVSEGYTTNFKHTVEIADEQIGQDFTFAVHANVKNNAYPVTLDFAIQLDGQFYLDHIESTMIIPQFNFANANVPTYDSSQYVLRSIAEAMRGECGKVFDGSKFKYNEETGFYHRYDAETDTYGEVLFAYITSPCPYVDKSLYNIEDDGNKSLTVSSGTENYKLFIQGYATLAQMGYHWIDSLTTAEKKMYANVLGYAGYVNGDGVYPVTAELKDFLQKFSISSMYFADGNGWVETQSGMYALEEDQWLFACCLYMPR